MIPGYRFFRIGIGSLILSVSGALFGLLIFSGCNKTGKNAQTLVVDSSDVYTLEVIKDRKKKDLYLLRSESSPLKATDREVFKGLDYYAPDKSFAFSVVLKRKNTPETVMIATSKDKPREMLNIGSLSFTRENVPYTLQVYMPKDSSQEKYWFIPFSDPTNETDTYHGGRFIDIENPSSDSTILDFNFCYNPYCAYNDRYDCPIPPTINRLSLAVKAGEKNFPLVKH